MIFHEKDNSHEISHLICRKLEKMSQNLSSTAVVIGALMVKWAACSCKLLTFVFNDIVCYLYFKVVLIILIWEAGDIKLNPGPDSINSSLSILHNNIRSIRNKLDYITENF